MNRLDSTDLPPTDNLDRLLGNFFKGEMPSPWPGFKPPARTRLMPDSPQRGRFAAHAASRLALLAVAVLLMLGTWLLPQLGSPRSSRPSGSLPILFEGTASPRGIVPPGTPGDKPGRLTPDASKEPVRERLDVQPRLDFDLDNPFKDR